MKVIHILYTLHTCTCTTIIIIHMYMVYIDIVHVHCLKGVVYCTCTLYNYNYADGLQIPFQTMVPVSFKQIKYQSSQNILTPKTHQQMDHKRIPLHTVKCCIEYQHQLQSTVMLPQRIVTPPIQLC